MSESNAPARRCKLCELDWPDAWHVYGVCLRCKCKTSCVLAGAPMTETQVESIKKHIAFDAYYAAREVSNAALIDLDGAFAHLLGGEAA